MSGKVWLMVLFAMFVSIPAFAGDAGTAAAAGDIVLKKYYMFVAMSAILSLGLAASAGGISQAHSIHGAVSGTARNPGASGKLLTTMTIGLAMIESLVIYVLVVALAVLYTNPFHV